MAIFKYTLPSGSQFRLEAPAGITQAQADVIFYQQVAAGSLVGYTAGQTLTSPATRITKFELSRLDRGTAGVDSNPILSISQGLPTVNNTPTNQTILAAVQDLPLPARMPNLTQTPLTSPVDQTDVVLIKGDTLGPDAVGPLTSFQIQKLLAQIKNLVDQEFDQISLEKGVGQYGFSCDALEQAGYVKPGTSLRFINNNTENFVAVMNSPSVWTGKDGIYSLTDLLNSADTQTSIQNELMQQGYDDLVATGVISTRPTSAVGISTGQVYVAGGLQSIGALSLLGSNPGSLNGLIQNALTGKTSLNTLLTSQITNLSTIGSGAVNSLGNLSNLTNLNFTSITGLTNGIKGDLGALVMNAGKFGSQATALWANTSLSSIGGNLSNGLTSLTGGFQNLATSGLNNITSSFNGIASNLTNLVPGSLSNLTANLNTFGKAGQFATNFANPLSSITNLSNLGSLGNLGALQGQLTGALTGQLSSITGALSGQLSSITGALSGQLSSITGALSGQLSSLTGAFGNLGSFANIGALGDVFGGGGDLVSGTQVAGGFNNTVNRSTVDAAFARIVGSSKVPLPTYEYPSLPSLAQRLDISQAQNFLKNLQSPSSSGIFGQTVTV